MFGGVKFKLLLLLGDIDFDSRFWLDEDEDDDDDDEDDDDEDEDEEDEDGDMAIEF